MKKRLLACLLTAAMLVSLFPLPALAAEAERPEWMVTAFDPLDGDTAAQTVPQGGEPVLPDSLTAWAYAIEDDTAVIPPTEGLEQEDEQPPSDSTGEPSTPDVTLVSRTAENTPEPAEKQEPDIQPVTIPNVTWTAEPEYDHNTPGAYIYTPVLPAAYAVDEGVELPAITVTVEAAREPEQTAVERVQALIDALPDPEGITLDNAEDTAAQIWDIDGASETLTEEERAALDFTRYEAVMLALAALMDDAPTVLDTESGIKYLGWDDSQKKLVEKTYTENATVVESSATEWTDGWYVVNSGDAENLLKIDSRVTVTGNVHLILADGYTLSVNGGIQNNGSLTIYGQSGGTGKLTAAGGDGEGGNSDAGSPGGAGGVGIANAGKAITINGGTVTATGGNGGEGYNGWQGGYGGAGGTGIANAGGTIMINGGTVTATGGHGGGGGLAGYDGGQDNPNGAGGVGGAGIGGENGTITMNGGTVTATGGNGGNGSIYNGNTYYGLGGDGGVGISGALTIENGSVTATGATGGEGRQYSATYGGAGIYGAFTIKNGTVHATGADGNYYGSGGAGIIGNANETVTINGGTVTATGGNKSAGISSQNGTITISDGEVTATGGENGAGIGGGNGSAGGTITINGGTVTANGGYRGAGIGGGNEGEGGQIKINNGTVRACGGNGGAGIGGGAYRAGGTITISGGAVTANGGSDDNNILGGAGIGGGGGESNIYQTNGGAGGTITITGGDVTATGAIFGAGIGGGGDGEGGMIEITGGTVIATGGDTAAGIGGGHKCSGGKITISGGTVSATGNNGGAGIGGGGNGAGGTVTISGGTVTATGGSSNGRSGAGIGGGSDNNDGGTFNTGDTGSAFIIASSISDNSADKKENWGGIIFDGTEGQVYGDQTLQNDFEFPGNHTLTIPADVTLTVPENVTLTNSSTLINDGTFENDGKVINDGTLINNGSITNIDAITGNGTIYDLTDQPSGDTVSYWTCDQSGQNWKLDERHKYTVVEAGTTIWGINYGKEQWYVVNGDVVISDRITVSGDVHLILADGCTLTAKNGIQVEGSDNSLTIYAQSLTDDTMGRLSASISGDTNYQAAIGGGNAGHITINGGAIDAKGRYRSAGIGGGQNSNGGVITINGGKVIATGGYGKNSNEGGAGIGGGRKGSGGTITINGGDVTATGNTGGAGIGGGFKGSGGTIIITGGTVSATGSSGGAGIGSGSDNTDGTFTTGADGNAFIVTTRITDQSNRNNWHGIIFEGDNGAAHGDSITLTADAEIKNGKTLTIPKGTTLTVPDGKTLTNNGTIIGLGTLDGEGNLEGSGTIEQTVINRLQKDSVVSVSVSSSSVIYGSTVTITATMSRATNTFTRAAENQVEFFVVTNSGKKSLGTANVNSTTAILSNVEISRENGFVTGENTITAEYGGSMGLKPQSGTATLTISKAEQTALQIANVTGKKYGDAPFTLTTTGGSGPGAVTFSVPSNNGVMTVSGDQATIIGTGTVGVTANKAGNEDYNPITATLKITIGKADALTLTNKAAMIRNHTGFTTEIDLTQTSGYPKTPGGTPTFTVTSTGYNALTSASVDKSGILTLVSNANSSHQSDTVTVSVEGMGNYDDSIITVNITYTDKKPVTITGVSAADNLIYNGRQQQGYTGTPASEYTGSYEISYNTQDKKAPMLPGEYTVTFKVPDSDMAYVGSKTLHFTIGKRPLTVKADDKTVVKGGKIPDLTYTATGLAEGDRFTGPKIETAAQDTNTTGTYNITISGGTLTNSDGYDVSYKNGTLTVTEKIIPSLTLTASPSSLSGGGTVQLTVGGLPDGGTVTVTCSDSGITPTGNGTTWAATLPNRTADYTFTAEYSGDSTHERVTADCTVKVTQYSSGGDNSGGGTTTTPTQKPSIEDSTGGSTTVIPVRPGETATIRPKPDEGYEVDKITVTDKDGKPVEVTVKPDGTYTFKQPNGKVTIKVTYKPVERPWNNPFTDVSENDWYYEAVRFVHERGLMNGYSDGRFGPNDNLSRAQLAQILFNKEGRPGVNYLLTFSDVAGEAWYTEAIRWATSQGIVSGYGNGMFGPNDPITREQLAVMLWRYSGSPAATNKELHFNDTDEISPFALEALRWAVENGILNGYGNGRLGPQGQATRAQVAQMLKNFIENQEENT